MKKIVVNCHFAGNQISPFTVYIGHPKHDSHPIQHQSHWLSKERGGTVPKEFLDSLDELHKLSISSGVDLGDLCMYAMETYGQSQNKQKESATSESNK